MRNKYLEFYKASFGSGEHCTKSWGLASFQAGAQSRQAEIDELQETVENQLERIGQLEKIIDQIKKEKLDQANKLDKIFYGDIK